MCGIAGITHFGPQPVDVRAVKRMCDLIAHRGPDDAGYAYFGPSSLGAGRAESCAFVDPAFRHASEHLPVYGGTYFHERTDGAPIHLALGHRRLSILDVSALGHQPMTDPEQRCWIAFNGEIYNFRELRADLEAAGHRFRSGSDTEVILHLWHRHGRRALEMLDGMFAFAIYDRVENELVLARDRFGVKPLYYAFNQHALAFGSEVKSVLASGLAMPEIDPDGLVQYLAFQNVFGDGTLFRGVKLLEPGACLVARPGESRPPRMERFHHGFPTADPSLGDEAEVTELVSEAFGEAVTRQLVSDVPVGAYLSGGMDSGSIVSVAGRSIPRLLTFTAGFDLTNVNGMEQGIDERGASEQLAYELQTEHYEVVLHAGDMPAVMDRLAWHLDDPRVGMCHQNWYAAKLASRFVKVCLAGTGGDELFGGYPWRYANGIHADDFAGFDDRYFSYWHRTFDEATLPGLFSSDLQSSVAGLRRAFGGVLADAPDWQPELDHRENMLQRALHFEFKTFLQGLFVVEDRISMAHSLESRVPFLDNGLADLAWRIRPSMKVALDALPDPRNGHLVSADGKRVLRTAMERFLPDDFTRQRKQGFTPPDANWYRGPSMEYIQSILLDSRTLDRPWFERRFVEDRLDEHFTGRCNHRLFIWSLLCLEWLQRHYVDDALQRTEAIAA